MGAKDFSNYSYVTSFADKTAGRSYKERKTNKDCKPHHFQKQLKIFLIKSFRKLGCGSNAKASARIIWSTYAKKHFSSD